MPGQSISKTEAFAAWRGRAVDVVVDWPARRTWSDIISPNWLYSAWSGTPYTKVFGVAPIPEDGSGSLANCAAGQYNDKWRQFASNIKAYGLDRTTIIRLGWEFNGDWYVWTARDPGAFAGCWRQIVTASESVAPDLRWEWTANRGLNAGLADARQAYPGDDYVDFVGVDSYDSFPGVTSESTWQRHYSAAYGLKFWADFATEHGKPLNVPEWGVYPGTAHAGNNGGDNPLYIGKMLEFFRELGPRLGYEAYFNESSSYYAGALFAPQQNPLAAARYQQEYSQEQ